MNIKSLLIGSAAALVAVSGARAADAIVAAEPEPVEYVRVCDAFGVGYFYIPGTETCLQLGGYVRVQNSYTGNDISNGVAFTAATGFVALADNSMVAQTSRARFNVTAKSDTEYGVLTSYIGMQGNDGAMGVDEVYLSLGGFKTGYFYHWIDSGLAGETDGLYNAMTRFNSIMYQANSGAFTFGVSLDQYPTAWATNSAAAAAIAGTEGLGVSGIIGGTFGAVTASLVGFYDTEVNEGGARFLAAAEVGPGTLGFQAAYATDANMYIGAGGFGVTTTAFAYQEWLVGADYTFQATEKLKLGVGGQYASINATAATLAGKPEVGDIWKVGMTADYAVTQGLALKGTVNYEVFDGNALVGNVERESITGFIRLQRSF
ncbi:MAG: porin [Hoeflea sp.]|uniref:porin n=1 Tax=Hoeflea sp. TaxID=1940281 RepID=UPI003EF725F7